MRLLKAVLFDFDNTLVDSAAALPLARRRVAEEIVAYYGNSLDVEEVAQVVAWVEHVAERLGILDRDLIWEHVIHSIGMDTSPSADILRRWSSVYWTEYMKGPLFPDTVSVLENFGRRYVLGMVTNTDGMPGMKMHRLERSGLLKFFKAVVIAGEDVPETKPSPRPFLHAAKLLNIKPEECIMVGDDPVNDVLGAKSAGMHAVLLDRQGGKPYPVKPDHIVKSLRELLALLDA
ncbi:MAG: HAD family hydrolase [Candidatus Caldarchaeum sp.]